ncbi:ubiquitin-conjugating enzyme E2 [Pelomyxa schiedti]|nr:ubiquitin-conjugating enzyme E2 [Pelomyxa schiedti]
MMRRDAALAIKRLQVEYKRILADPPPGAAAAPVNDSNMFLWQAVIIGPPDTDYSGGAFTATLTFPSDYPLSPPKMKFQCPMFHPNIFPSGEVCISILHPPGEDPNHYESSVERWTPVQSIEKILVSVISMLSGAPCLSPTLNFHSLSSTEPNIESPANLDAAKLYRYNRGEYTARVRRTVEASLAMVNRQLPRNPPTQPATPATSSASASTNTTSPTRRS